MAHANARLTVHGRALLVRRVVTEGRPAAHVAAELGVSRQCAYRWVARFRAEGPAGLLDRSSRPHRSPRRTSLLSRPVTGVFPLVGRLARLGWTLGGSPGIFGVPTP